jgi:membrane protein
MDLRQNLSQLLADLARFPWLPTALTLRERFREDRLGLSASSLTFTTMIALVPFFTVALAVFTAFPMFSKVQSNLQAWLVQSLVPDAIARQVLGYLTQFAGKASRLGGVGLAALLFSALALVLTIDRTLNNIWRVRRPRPLGQRVLLYWAAITLGPMLLASSLATTSYVVSAGRGLVSALPSSSWCSPSRSPRCTGMCPTRPSSASTPWPVESSSRSASSWRSACWPGTSARCPRIRWCTAPSPPCPSCWSGSISCG